MAYREADQEEVKALFLPRCVALAGADNADEDLIEFVAAALVELLIDGGDDLEDTATETAVPYLSSFLEEDQAAAVVKEVLQDLAVGGGGGGSGGGGGGGADVGAGEGGKKKKKKHRKGRSSGQAARGTKGQAGALGRNQLHDRRARDKKS